MMELVLNKEEIIENAKRANAYLNMGTIEEKEFMLEKISTGMCFVVIKDGENYEFYPSKYIGYKGNSLKNYYDAYFEAAPLPGEDNSKHAAMYTFDGRMSNKAINKVLGCKCVRDYAMSQKFIKFCNRYGLKGSEKRKFWLNVIEL